MTDEFDTDIRTALRSAAGTIERDEHRAAQIIANARAGRSVVVPLRQRQGTWMAPLLAAVAVLVVAAAVLVATNVFGGTGVRPATPTVAVPPGFRAVDVDFVNPQLGFAVGAWPCPHHANRTLAPSRRATLSHSGCAAMIRTTDGGRTWSRAGLPSGVWVADGTAAGAQPGCDFTAEPRPCVDHVTFADARRGYVWSSDAIYWTTDGGRSWSRPHDVAERAATWSLQIVGDYVLRLHSQPSPLGCNNCAGQLERAPVGVDQWQRVSAVGADLGVQGSFVVASRGNIYVLAASPGFPTRATVWMSADHGATWNRVWNRPCPRLATSLSADAEGSLAVVCDTRWRGGQSVLRVLQGSVTTRATIADAPLHVAMLDQRHVALLSPISPNGVLVYLSHDGGYTFGSPRAIPANISTSLATPQFVNSRDGVGLARTPNGIVATTDGGRTWHVRTFG